MPLKFLEEGPAKTTTQRHFFKKIMHMITKMIILNLYIILNRFTSGKPQIPVRILSMWFTAVTDHYGNHQTRRGGAAFLNSESGPILFLSTDQQPWLGTVDWYYQIFKRFVVFKISSIVFEQLAVHLLKFSNPAYTQTEAKNKQTLLHVFLIPNISPLGIFAIKL